MSQRDASDTTARRKNRVIYADKVIQETTLANGIKNYVIRQGAMQGKRAANYDIFYYPSEEGAVETTIAEQATYIASATPIPALTLNIETFLDVGTFSWTAPLRTTSVTYLVVAGGGGSGGGYDTGGGAGGGGGMVLTGELTVIPGTTYTITVGDGGVGGISNRLALPETPGSPGENSVFASITALGGGGGYPSRQPAGAVNGNGGVAAGVAASTGGNGGGSNGGGGGGGGSSGNGSNKSGTTGGNGGQGTTSDLSGTSTIYGAGGRGGNGGANNAAVSGTANTGNGARGAGATSFADENGAKGGSGIVIIRYYY